MLSPNESFFFLFVLINTTSQHQDVPELLLSRKLFDLFETYTSVTRCAVVSQSSQFEIMGASLILMAYFVRGSALTGRSSEDAYFYGTQQAHNTMELFMNHLGYVEDTKQKEEKRENHLHPFPVDDVPIHIHRFAKGGTVQCKRYGLLCIHVAAECVDG